MNIGLSCCNGRAAGYGKRAVMGLVHDHLIGEPDWVRLNFNIF